MLRQGRRSVLVSLLPAGTGRPSAFALALHPPLRLDGAWSGDQNHEIGVTAVGVDCTCARASRDRLCRDATCCDPAGHRLVELGLKAKGK